MLILNKEIKKKLFVFFSRSSSKYYFIFNAISYHKISFNDNFLCIKLYYQAIRVIILKFTRVIMLIKYLRNTIY